MLTYSPLKVYIGQYAMQVKPNYPHRRLGPWNQMESEISLPERNCGLVALRSPRCRLPLFKMDVSWTHAR